SQSNFSKEKQLSDIIAQKILGLTDITQITKYTDDTNDITLKAATENLFSASSPVYASSEIGEDADIYNLFYPNPGRYWHVALDKIGESAWVMIDLGEDQKKIVNFIRTKPRPDTMQQSFKTAVIQGSPDAKSWKNIAAIITEDPPETRDWKGWYFLNNTPYRFYRFLVLDGHEVNGAFYSLGAMEMYHVINSRQGSKKWGIGNGG
ncbi:MAG: discoidin domain-containing protein, partial [Candidatus Auribacterota bacterium]|nr:discoidin domain-containing protein [Candidatus Auribacterota bacterium]